MSNTITLAGDGSAFAQLSEKVSVYIYRMRWGLVWNLREGNRVVVRGCGKTASSTQGALNRALRSRNLKVRIAQ